MLHVLLIALAIYLPLLGLTVAFSAGAAHKPHVDPRPTQSEDAR